MSTARKQEGKKGSDAHRSASKRKARGSRCQQGEGHRRRSKLTITNPDAAGIDIGAQVHYVSVPEDRAEVSVRSFARANHIGPKTSVKDLRVLRPKIALLPFDHAG